MFERLRPCVSKSSVLYIGRGNRIWTWLSCTGNESYWREFVIFEDLLIIFPLDFSEHLVIKPEFLLPGILMHVLLYKTVEEDNVRIKRGNESDVCQSNFSSSG
jgi:hypothetical protein